MKIFERATLLLSLLNFALMFAPAANGQEKSKAQDNTPTYRNPGLTVDERVADLLPRMTLEEKVQQLMGGSDAQAEVIDPTGTIPTSPPAQS